MQALNVAFIGLMATVAAIDYKTLKVPMWSLFAVLILAIFKGFMFADMFQGFLLMVLSFCGGWLVCSKYLREQLNR